MAAIKLKPLSEQVIVITGSSSGIGLAAAYSAAERGAKVVLGARSEDTLASIVEQIHAAGGEALFVPTDVTSKSDVCGLAKDALSRFGRIDTWVNNAAVSIYGRLDEVTDEDSRALFETNFWGTVYGSLVALPILRATGGALINVGSEVSDAFVPLQGMYAASKHAVKGFTDALRVEVEGVDEADVAITLIQPTAVDTPYPQHARNYMDREPKLPTPRIDPQRVADAILDAACHHRRDVLVGVGAYINTMMSKIAPTLFDALSARQADRQQYDEPPRAPEGTIYEPGQTGQIHGSGGRERNGSSRHP
jgi:short-subunit dehydrogenase